MPEKPIVIRAKHAKGVTTVRALITHPMVGHNNLSEENATDKRPHYIQEITCRLGDETILSALCGSYIAKDPFLAFTFKGGNKGDSINLRWVDNWGERGSVETVIY